MSITQAINRQNKPDQAFLRPSNEMRYLGIGQTKLLFLSEQDSDFPRKIRLSTRFEGREKMIWMPGYKPSRSWRYEVATSIKRKPSLAVQVTSSEVSTHQNQYAAPVEADGVEMPHEIRGRPWVLDPDSEPWQIAYVALALCECEEGA